MVVNCQGNMQYIPHKEIVKQKGREYYYKNKERIQEQGKSKYKSLSPEEKKNDKNIIKNGLKNNQLSDRKN